MIRAHDQKPKRKSLRCCYCWIEVLSGFLLLMLVASAITLLRYFLEFSNFPFKVTRNEPELGSNQTHNPVPVGSITQSPSGTSFRHKIISQQTTTLLKPNSSLTPSWRDQGSPHLPPEMSSPLSHPGLPTRPTSARPPSSSVSHQLTLVPEKSPFHRPTPGAKLQDLTSAEGPTSLPQNATKLTSSQSQASAVGWTPQTGLATKWEPFLNWTARPLPQSPSTMANMTSPHELVAPFSKPVSSPLSSDGDLATKWRFLANQTEQRLPQHPTTIGNLTSPQEVAMSAKMASSAFSSARSLAPKWRSALKQTSDALPQHPSTTGNLASPQERDISAQTVPSLFSSVAPYSSPQMVQGTISGTPQLPVVTPKQPSLSQATSGRKLSSLSQLGTRFRLTVVTPNSPESLALPSSRPPPSFQVLTLSQGLWSTREVADLTDGNGPSHYLWGSFHLLNEAYDSSYSDPTSDNFKRLASKLENMINDVFLNSALKKQFRGSSVLAFNPEPLRANFLLQFHDNTQGAKLHPNTVAQEIKHGCHGAQNTALIDEGSVRVEGDNGFCVINPASSLSILTGASQKQDHWKNPQALGNAKSLQNNKEWAWIITVLKDGHPICTGSMITENWALSTKSCLALDDLSSYTLKLGSYEKHPLQNKLYTVTRIVHHSSDITLLQLARSVPISPWAHPICLPDSSRGTTPGTECWSVGSKKNHHSSQVLEWTIGSSVECSLATFSGWTCAKTSENKQNLELTPGGPLVCLAGNQQIYLEGVMPFSASGQSKTKKQKEDRTAAFIQIAPLVPWITSQLFP